MFKLFETKIKKVEHFVQLIAEQDFTAIMEKMEEGYEMNANEKNLLDKVVERKVQEEGVMFLSDLYKEGYDIKDEWLLKWAKSRKFVTNYNLDVFGAEYFKKRLENLAPDILSFYLYRMDNLSMGISRSHKVCYLQAVEVFTSVRNYSTIIEHIQTGISDSNLNDYYYKLKNLNKIVKDSPTFYSHLEPNASIDNYLKDLEKIITVREAEQKKSKKLTALPIIDFNIPRNIQDYIERIYDNYEKCIDNQYYLKLDAVNLLDRIRNERVGKLIKKFKNDEDKEFFIEELKKIDNTISAVLVSINKQKMSEANKEYLTGRPRNKF